MRRPLQFTAWVFGGLLSLTCLGAPPGAQDPHPGGAPSDATPRPIIAWPAGPLEVRVAFDRPIDPAVAQALVGQAIPFGEPVKPGNTGSAVTLASTLGTLRIAAARLDDAGRTLLLATDPHPREATYVLTLPAIRGPGQAGPGTSAALAYGLTGAEVAWEDDQGGESPAWSGWWPLVDSREARTLTSGSVEHDRGFALLARPGRFTLRTFVALPKGKVTVRLEAGGPIEATLANEDPRPIPDAGDRHRAEWDLESTGEAVELAATIPTGAGGQAVSAHASYHTESDAVERPLPRAWQILPWAPPPAPAAAPPAPLPFALAGGDRGRGEAVFFSEEAKCSTCHKYRGRGGDVGPDLGELAGRDPAEVYRDIADPSAVIKPEFNPYTVALKNGQVAVGVVRAEGAHAIRVLDTNGKATLIPRDEVEELRPSSTSVMPVGLAPALGEARLRDLLTFLLSPPPESPKSK